MKIILTASAIAMVVAGIYGAADMGKDIRQGTMIDYEADTRPLGRIATKYNLDEDLNAPLKEKIAAYLEKKKKEEEEAKRKYEASLQTVNYEYFSRGEPIDYREMMTSLQVDSLAPKVLENHTVTTADTDQQNEPPKK